ncbi:MAG: thiamine phosphate synthase [Spirochaetes bacterium]|nr:thiamine phosphate synthase [Spirochaetota bacterium]
MKDFGLYVIITSPVVMHEKIAESCVRHGVEMIQLREKNLCDRDLLALAKRLKSITAGSQTKLIINDRPDIALLCGADGTHAGQDDLKAAEVRSLTSETGSHLIGISTHNFEQAKEALSENPDYIGFGPVFPTFAKRKPDPVTGTDLLKQVLEFSEVPVTAIGGINRHNIDSVIEAGAKNIAMISAVCKSEKYDEEIRFFADKLRKT